jgi:hypothetical protein
MFKIVTPFTEIISNYYTKLKSSVAIRPIIQQHKCSNTDVFLIYVETRHGYED